MFVISIHALTRVDFPAPELPMIANSLPGLATPDTSCCMPQQEIPSCVKYVPAARNKYAMAGQILLTKIVLVSLLSERLGTVTEMLSHLISRPF